MRLYHLLNRLPLPRSYVGKFLVTCFLGTHAPLVCFAVYAIFRLPFDTQLAQMLALIVIATLGGTIATLLVVRMLLSPIIVAEKALKAYVRDGVKPELPTFYRDEAGSLLSEIQNVVDHLENCVADAERNAMTDPLTSVGNRRWLTTEGRKALVAARNSRASLSVILFDIDHFKSVNDRFGHPAGDAVLRNVAGAVQGLLRPCDLFARIGGEEFCVILPDVEQCEAAVAAERLRTAIADLRHAEIDRPITASFGVATMTPRCRTLIKLLSEADMLLYTAKRYGRNRVCTGAVKAGTASAA